MNCMLKNQGIKNDVLHHDVKLLQMLFPQMFLTPFTN